MALFTSIMLASDVFYGLEKKYLTTKNGKSVLDMIMNPRFSTESKAPIVIELERKDECFYDTK